MSNAELNLRALGLDLPTPSAPVARGRLEFRAAAIPRKPPQCAPLRLQDVVQVTVLPWSHALHAATHWFMSRGL